MNAAIDRLRALYRPEPAIPRADLQDLADGLQAQLVALSEDPTPARCEAVATNLDGARRAVLRLREALMQEATHGATP